MRILVLNGPNINLLGQREPEIYGHISYHDLLHHLQEAAAERQIELDSYQSNHEGDLVDAIQQAYGQVDGIIFNPAAYTHTSIALLDALKAVGLPTVEVHLSDPNQREPYRHHSYIREACFATISGKGIDGYVEALDCLFERLSQK